MIKAVLFDVDGVLLDSFEANLKFFQDLMTMNGYKPPAREEFRPLFHFPLVDTIKALTGSTSEQEIARLCDARRDREISYDVNLLAMPEDAEEAIRTLNRTHSLGIVTSRIRENVYEGPELARLKRYFQVAVSFEDTEKHKPDPDPLIFAARKLGIRPEEAVYIGDAESDAQAAKSASMKFILYSNEPFGAMDLYTSSFRKLPELIASL